LIEVQKEEGIFLACGAGCLYPILRGIPRFVSNHNYASSFGLQWNAFRTTQLDSHTGATISRERLARLLGGSLHVVENMRVLEAGCGAGRFTEVLLGAGAIVSAVDISTAVEANYCNCRRFPGYSVCQSSILSLPFPPEEFDVVVCVGVVQHTPNPEETMAALCRQVKPGGLLVMDHYTHDCNLTVSRRLLRALLVKLPSRVSLSICKVLTHVLWPFHQILWRHRSNIFVERIRNKVLHFSPLLDYHHIYPELGSGDMKAWCMLDTHDALTDVYKHLRSADEITAHLRSCGMNEVETTYAGNGVEARARKGPRAACAV
jgi:2-polyprenyl-3-methyl-5-hydroxy-6-metoxy-1,4-benzoquinol methylase